jgi:hypothetical protein
MMVIIAVPHTSTLRARNCRSINFRFQRNFNAKIPARSSQKEEEEREMR